MDDHYQGMSSSEIVQAARLYMLRVWKLDYVAAAAYAMVLIETDKVPYMGVDQWWRLYYNPDTIRAHPIQENAAVIYHEIWHLLSKHSMRFQNLANSFSEAEKEQYGLHQAWNIAADMEINDDLRKQSIPLPQGSLHPSMCNFPEGELAEEYFDRLLKAAEQLRKMRQQAEKNPLPGFGKCGSCATGQQEAWEEGPPPDGEGENGTPGVTEVEGEIIRKAVAREIVESHSRNPDNIPEGLVRWAQAYMAPPQVPWQHELAAAMRRAVTVRRGMVDYVMRPSRRQGMVKPGDIIMPSLVKPLPAVAVILDTSGSITENDLKAAMTEIHGICRTLGAAITVLSTDCAVHSRQQVVSANQVKPIGGGGTDMGVGLRAAAALRPKPDVVVVLTDGYTPWPAQSPCGAAKVIVVTVGASGPGWAKTIKIKS